MINKEMQKNLMGMSVSELTELQKFCSDLKIMKNKGDLSVGQRVYVVQKTKKTPGTVRKINKTRAIVDMVTNPITGAVAGYNVPFSMLEAA
jgi:FKBP-type peptidyl-prolyl cis-trans isomerase 2|tara:strand:+ start:972 stop:1244 length:273 start_codon:yes stop_codon:yes gene_type:complete